ncbi:MAG: bifunctional 5,10-methylene-tetrahydrofolate dehydrogenase/5,10-methylene-tetrahydrofolate cyclohydrolase [Clostridia bacterium]|nr:bifunctional 5,10-methylene-tetrahydrofolate dehydrogenase/5,10-methylene-tetrahydrofolate cyclohydrolase [Clostridia bacterium]
MEWRGKPVADRLTEELTNRITALRERGCVPKLMLLRVGERPEDLAYERGIRKRFASAGAEIDATVFPETVSQEELTEAVRSCNDDPSVHGVLLFRPLPGHLNEDGLLNVLKPDKDVDGMTAGNALRVYLGDKSGFAPCTAQAVLEMLDANGCDVCGKHVVVVGRSRVVGKPLAMLLLARHATVTVCHSRTKDLQEICRQADILVACVGKARMIGSAYVKPGMIVLDVGINEDGDGICGDVDTESVAGIVSAVTPVPGGVGSVTTSVLLKHVVEQAERTARP